MPVVVVIAAAGMPPGMPERNSCRKPDGNRRRRQHRKNPLPGTSSHGLVSWLDTTPFYGPASAAALRIRERVEAELAR